MAATLIFSSNSTIAALGGPAFKYAMYRWGPENQGSGWLDSEPSNENRFTACQVNQPGGGL